MHVFAVTIIPPCNLSLPIKRTTGRGSWDVRWPKPQPLFAPSLAVPVPRRSFSPSPALLSLQARHLWERRWMHPRCSRPFSFLPGTSEPLMRAPSRSHEVGRARGPHHSGAQTVPLSRGSSSPQQTPKQSSLLRCGTVWGRALPPPCTAIPCSRGRKGCSARGFDGRPPGLPSDFPLDAAPPAGLVIGGISVAF